ncbi:carboxypeptidase M32 [Sneathiella chungangensis]|uniref:Metal-dependent carboxypeptidase n=1 Tax=Sneathiella chungangensis TaxID=1418234 RepID=A0A845MHP5_9PROT|nr:carboxypeptidase M32 [Sneathiella chungangensis]MZR23488.1 carboxypeptidase M32 [Sneathiella chungangensis]
MPDTTTAYQALEKKFARLSAISGAAAMLHWDSAAMMPPGGAEARSEQLATLSLLSHEILTSGEISDLLDGAEDDAAVLTNWQQANLREMRNRWCHATAVKPDLVEAQSRATSRCEMLWREARLNNDFASFAPSMEEVILLTRRIADAKSAAFSLAPYDSLLDEYEPGCTSDSIDRIFSDLEIFLPDFLAAVLERQKSDPPPVPPKGPFNQEMQKALGLEFMTSLGFDFNHGRLDISHHPFTGGIPDDVRLTTRYETEDFAQSLMGTLHETGHALYEQGLPREWRSQPVGAARGMALHESQSLLIEMQLSRSEDFLAFALPKIKAAFGGDGAAWDEENIRRLYQKVEPGFIRVDADEVTYPLHVMLRYRLEKALLAGDLAVKDLPAAWNSGMRNVLGITPPNDRLGCLQDIHWPSGAIGYFPTYTLGALAAAQIYRAAGQKIPDLATKVRAGRFEDLIAWLRENIHSLGSSLPTGDIMTSATGSPLETEAFKAHLRNRYLK